MSGFQSSVFDSQLYSPLFTQAEMKHIWSDNHLIETWLTFETSIAQVQSELGIIPKEAANSIKQACQTITIDWDKLSQDTQTVGMAIKPLIDQLSAHDDDLVKQYLHWGCTTQDLLDTSLAMRLKASFNLIQQQLITLGDELKTMTMEHKQTVMVARTNSMDALPTTWGLQVSSYLQEVTRHLERLIPLSERATTGLFGGAVGNLSSVGEQGIAIRNALFKKLGLKQPIGLRNASLDHVTETVQFFALVHGTLVRIANDIEFMGRTSIAEAREGEGGGGSSTMPHKANPRACNMIKTLSRMGWMYASGAPNLMDQQDVRSASMRVLNWSIVPESALTISTSLEQAIRLIQHLVINPDNMRRNFQASKHFIMSEAVMMKMAEKVGREKGYKTVQQAIKTAPSDIDFIDLMLENTEVNQILSVEEISHACDPMNYLGANDQLIAETVEYFDAVVKTIK